jgi:hypothetical protein
MNCGLRHFGNDVMQLSYCHASICANFSFSFLKEVVRYQKMAHRYFVRREHQSFRRRIHGVSSSHLPIHNLTINSKNLFVNCRWTFTFYIEKSYDGTHLSIGGTLDRRCHFKHVSLKQSRFYHCQTSTAHR